MAFFHSRSGVFWNLVFPVALTLLYGTLFSETGGRSPVLAVRDLDSTPASRRLIALVQQYTGSRLQRMTVPLAELDAYLTHHSIPRVLVIPAGFERALQDTTRPSGLYYRADSQPASFAVLGGIYAAANVMDFELLGARPRILVQRDALQGPGAGSAGFYVSGVIAMSIMYTGMFGMGLMTSSFRRFKMFKKLATTPMRRWEWIVSQVAILVTLSLLSTALVVGSGEWLNGSPLPLSPVLVPILVLGVLCFGSLGALIGSTGATPEATAGAINAIALPMMLLSGTFIDFDVFPRVLRILAHLLPLTYVTLGIRDVMVYDNLQGALRNLAYVAGFAGALLWLGARMLKWRETS
jgi:ABC-2 type transport system permease protein